jgi:putative FmdB family regulatory protein
MPIYEFYCGDCHRLFSFLSRKVNSEARPACPKCGRRELARRASSFAISKRRPEPPVGGEAMSGPDDARLEKAMQALAGEAEGLNEDDPRQAAHLMRRMFEAAGVPVGAGMQEAMKRMEAGEDPETVEAEMGDVFEQDPFAAAEPKAQTGRLGRLRRMLPPSVDPTLYEM